MNSKGKEQSFTLMELMIVVVIIGIIAGFAIPSYQKAMAKQKARRLILTAKLIDGAQEIYKARNGRYWCDFSVSCMQLSEINSGLGLNIIPETGASYLTFQETIPPPPRSVINLQSSDVIIQKFYTPEPKIICINGTPLNACPCSMDC